MVRLTGKIFKIEMGAPRTRGRAPWTLTIELDEEPYSDTYEWLMAAYENSEPLIISPATKSDAVTTAQ